ncbi:MAG: DUF2191 domain-containing protein [Pseudomonadota bacterium]
MRIDDDLLKKAKRRAAEQGCTLTSLMEDGLRPALAEDKPPLQKRVRLPVSKASGGVLPGVDLNRWSELEEVMNRQPRQSISEEGAPSG